MTPETVAAEAWCSNYFRYDTVAALMEGKRVGVHGPLQSMSPKNLGSARPQAEWSR